MINPHNDNFAFKITNLAGKELVIYADGYVKGLEFFFVKTDPIMIVNRIPTLIYKDNQ